MRANGPDGAAPVLLLLAPGSPNGKETFLCIFIFVAGETKQGVLLGIEVMKRTDKFSVGKQAEKTSSGTGALCTVWSFEK